MAPTATETLVTSLSKVEVSKAPATHVHGAEDKTPLEAISHGPLLHPGMINLYFSGLKLHQQSRRQFVPKFVQSSRRWGSCLSRSIMNSLAPMHSNTDFRNSHVFFPC